MASAFANQIQNRNFLSPLGFRFSLAKIPKVNFFCNSARIPEINLGIAVQPSYLKDIDVPGEKLTYGDLTIRFLVDENMENYMAVHNWLTGLGFPETAQDFKDTAEALFTGRLGLLEWIEKRPLSEGESSFQDLLRNKVAAPKIVLEPWQ